MSSSRLLLPFTLLLMTTSVACGGAEVPADDPLEVDLEKRNGGFDGRKETPGFGDADAMGLPEFGPLLSLGDALAESPAAPVTPAVPSATAHRYRVVLLWGRLPFQDDDRIKDRHDWSGRVFVDQGVIDDLRTVKFDKKDFIADRTPAVVTFVSHTRPAIDGLLFEVSVPPGAAEVLHVDTASIKLDIDLTAFKSTVGGVKRIEDGNGLVYAGYEERDGCQGGLMFGRWREKEGKRARFVGRVFDPLAENDGWVRGIFGKPRGSQNDRFFGKVTTTSGAAHALLEGSSSGGRATGTWETFTAGSLGTVDVLANENDGKGAWLGRHLTCPTKTP